MSSAENVQLDISVLLVQDQNMKIHVHKEHSMLLLVMKVRLKMMPANHAPKEISVAKKDLQLSLVHVKPGTIVVSVKRFLLIDHAVLVTTVPKVSLNLFLARLENTVHHEL